MSKRSQKKSGSRAARSKKYVPRVRPSKPPPPRAITPYEPPPRTDGYLDDGPERDDDMGPLPDGAWWFETYTASRDGIVPFEGDFDSDLDDDAWDEAFAAWCAAADLEGRTAFERCEPRAQLHELFDGVLEDLEAGLAREVAARAFDALAERGSRDPSRGRLRSPR